MQVLTDKTLEEHNASKALKSGCSGQPSFAVPCITTIRLEAEGLS